MSLNNSFLFGITTGIAVCTVSHYFFSYIKQCLLIVYPTPDVSTMPLMSVNNGGGNKSITARRTESPPPSYHQQDVFERLENELQIPSIKLSQMVKHLVSEMKKGLASNNQNLKMLPSYVVSRPSGTETGTVLALDLGGSNFRVCLIDLEGQGLLRMKQKKYVVSQELKKGTGRELFDFFADCVGKFLKELGQMDTEKELVMGFTFSFPVKQAAIDKGYLMHWNKGFTCSGVVNEDVGKLLNEALKRKEINVRVNAIVNDTVGALIANAYNDPQTYIGVILGTGTNAAYVERIEEVGKEKISSETGEIIINTEWGAYNEPSVLPITKYDNLLDRSSSNPKQQIFEKMISGMYLGEITRLILVDLISTGELFHGNGSSQLRIPYGFDTAFMSRIERDHTLDLSDTKVLIEELFGVSNTKLSDRRLIKKVCELVGTRAARLAAAGVAAIVTKTNRLDACTVAIDGSLFEHYPHFGNRMRDALREMLGITAENIILEQSRDGSGQGAALIAALHQ